MQIAQAHQRAGHIDEARHNYELAKRAGLAVGQKNLADAERQAYFATVKLLGEDALAPATSTPPSRIIGSTPSPKRSGLETLRTLADLYEKKGDALSAMRVTDQALAAYNAKDKDLLERKDRYYYSVMPDWFRGHPERVPGGFDLAYCLDKSHTLLNLREIDLDTLDWAQHLADLAFAVKPEGVTARLLLARAKLRAARRSKRCRCWKTCGNTSRSGSPTTTRSRGTRRPGCWATCTSMITVGPTWPWLATRSIGKAPSGADTLYKMGQAYEMLGDLPHAAKAYEQVTAYEGHPLAYEARSALSRVKQGQPS